MTSPLILLGTPRRATPRPFLWGYHGRHLSGQHNQKTHGDGGGGSHTGISRGSDKVWKDSDGQPLPAAEQTRLNDLKVPPAWKDVSLSRDPNADLQATGLDSKGRKQYLYSTAHSERQAAKKFERLKEFDSALPALRERISADAVNSKSPHHEAASVLSLVDKTGFRIGSDSETGAKVKAFGASTLEARHIQVDKNNNVTFNFVGKKGVTITKQISDPDLAQNLRTRLQGAAPTDRVFNVSDSQVRDYMHSIGGADFKVKDFRTWNGTSTAIKEIQRMPIPKTDTEYKRSVHSVAVKVAAHLGNTPTIALSAYIDPSVFSPWKQRSMSTVTRTLLWGYTAAAYR